MNTRLKHFTTLLLIALFCIAIQACGHDSRGSSSSSSSCTSDQDCKGDRICDDGRCISLGDGSTTDDGSGNTGTSDGNTGTSDGNQPPTNATCAETCTQLLDACPQDGVTQQMCENYCQSEFDQAMRNCLATASTCADADHCESTDSGGDDGGSSSNDDGNTGSDDGAIGSSCISGLSCDSGLCKFSAGATRGQCAENDLGERCQQSTDCLYDRCMIRDQSDDFGYCSMSCSGNLDCPFGWSCKESANAAAKYCDR
ncbi:MAG: hypothetical protein ACNA8W_07510 [Bradymonadaceae bacterium]